MAWIYLAESVGSVLLLKSGSDQSPIASVIDTARVSYCLGCDRATLHPLQSTTMCELSMEGCFNRPGRKLYTEDFHAKTLALQEMESAWMESEADYFGKSSGSLKKLNRSLYFSKTYQQLELGDSTLSCNHLPSSGMTVAGRLYQHKKLEPVTLEKGGSCLPTPMVSQKTYDNQKNGTKTYSLSGMASQGMLPTPMARDWKGSCGANRESPDLPRTMGGTLNPQFVEEIMGYEIGWTSIRGNTELEAWGMPWFRPKREKRL